MPASVDPEPMPRVGATAHVPAAGAPRFDVPVLACIGGWMLVFSYDIGGTTGLVLPGIIGWALLVVALLRALTGRTRATSMTAQERRSVRRVWLGCASGLVLLAGGELFLSHALPDAWRAAMVQALHVRRVYRQYGS